MNRFLRICRSVHSWTGALLMPLILIIGATGFYLNHAQTVLGLLGDSTFSESGLKDMKPAQPVTEDSTRRLAETIWPDLPVLEIARGTYHGWPVLAAAKTGGLIMVSIKTGHYYAKTEFTRKTFAADGELLDTKYYWNAVFKSLHERGWIGHGMGSWLADIVALAMIFFGLSGLTMWMVPKVRGVRRRLSP